MQAIYPNFGFRKHLRTTVTQEIYVGQYEKVFKVLCYLIQLPL